MKDKPPHQFSKVAEALIGDLRGLQPEDPPRSRKRPSQPLAGLVEELLQKHRIGREAPEHMLREQWPALVGAANATYSHPVVIERNRLIVIATHAVVRNELFLHRDEILARIRKVRGCEHIKALFFRHG